MTLCFTCIYSTALASGQFPVTVMTSHAHPPMRWPHAAVTTTNKTSVSSLEAVADQHRAVSTSDLQSSTTACIDQWRVRCGDAFGQLPCRVAQDGQNHLKSRLTFLRAENIIIYYSDHNQGVKGLRDPPGSALGGSASQAQSECEAELP